MRFYRAHRSQSSTKKLVLEIKRTAVAIASMPEAGSVALDLEPVGKYHHHVVAPYRIIYRFDEASVTILRIWDARKDPPTGAIHKKSTSCPQADQ